MTKPHQPWFIRRRMPAKVAKIHLIGIAGAAMGAFAFMLEDAGFEVRGSDRNVYPPMSDELRSRGIAWMEGWAAEHLDWSPDLVIVGNIARADNPEALEAEKRGIPTVSFPQAFCDLFLDGRRPIVIAGTHGKTTTTALTTTMLHHVGADPGMLVGGVTLNFKSTYRLGAATAPFVIEGDEYDTAFFDKGPKFLHYRPSIAVLNNIEFDHADIYDTLDEIIENFDRLMDLMGPGTVLFANADDPLVMARAARAKGRVITYGSEDGAMLQAVDVVPGAGGARFTLRRPGHPDELVESPLAGRHNVWNTLAALGIGLELGHALPGLIEGIQQFKGTKKRQEERGEAGGVLVIDDYAHHPTAIRETVNALKARYPGRRLWAVYEPKSNTARRNVHQAEYATAFGGADEVILARPYQKEDRFGPDEALDVHRLVAEINANGTTACYQDGVPATLAYLLDAVQAGDVVAFMSGSGFGGIHDKLLTSLALR